ncbi:unnamed protein product, partial [Hymenolepis diminuta]
ISNEKTSQSCIEINLDKHEHLVKKFVENLRNANISQKNGEEYPFDILHTDFDRVCYMLKVLENSNRGKRGIEVLGLPQNKDELVLPYIKSDDVANMYLIQCEKSIDEDNLECALEFINQSYFSAVSERAKALALLNRSTVLYELKCYSESQQDAYNALKVRHSEIEEVELYLTMARCYVKLNCPVEAEEYFKKALMCIDLSSDSTLKSLKTEVLTESSNCKRDCLSIQSVRSGTWKCTYREPPETLNGITLQNRNSSTIPKRKSVDSSSIANSSKLLSNRSGVLRLKNTKSDIGWTLVASRDVLVGDILLTERPYASVLLKTELSHCYNCYKRCLNIL